MVTFCGNCLPRIRSHNPVMRRQPRLSFRSMKIGDPSKQPARAALRYLYPFPSAIPQRRTLSASTEIQTIAICSAHQAQCFVQSKQKKVFTPHNALIDTIDRNSPIRTD